MQTTNLFEGHSRSLTAPGEHAITINPSDTDDLSHMSRAIYIGTGGDLRATLAGGQTVVFRNLVSGSILPIFARRIWAGGTSASDLISLF